MANPNIGRFCWYELMTPDPKAAIAFYGDVIGWKTQAFEGGGSDGYQLWVSSQGPVGGVMSQSGAAAHSPDPAKVASLPPHWSAHVFVENVDAKVAEVKKLDGKVLYEPTDIPNVGRFAVIGDPQGAALSVFTPKPTSTPMPPHDESKHGEFSWNELVTTNKEAAFDFYSKLFGWKKRNEIPLGAMGTYLIYGTSEKDIGGMFTKTKDMPAPTGWAYYIHVDDLDATVERAKSKGGKVISGPMEVPGGDRIAQLSDPQGASFALHEAKKK